MSVTLRNLSRRPLVVVLDHPAFRDKQYGFSRVAMTMFDRGRDGTVAQRIVRRSIVGSLTVPPRGSVGGLHPAIVNVAQVRGMVAAGLAEVVQEVAVAPGVSRSEPFGADQGGVTLPSRARRRSAPTE